MECPLNSGLTVLANFLVNSEAWNSADSCLVYCMMQQAFITIGRGARTFSIQLTSLYTLISSNRCGIARPFDMTSVAAVLPCARSMS